MLYSSKEICEYLINSKYISIDKNAIGRSDISVIELNYHDICFDSKFINMYVNNINQLLKEKYNTNNILVTKEASHMICNSILSWYCNLNLAILSRKTVSLKSIAGLDKFKTNYESQTDTRNIVIPVFKYPETQKEINIYLYWIKLIVSTFKPNRLIILIYFDTIGSQNIEKLKTDFSDKAYEYANENTSVIFKSVFDTKTILLNIKNAIDSELYERLNIFLETDLSRDNNSIDLNKGILKFLDVKKKKKSKLCVSVESIKNNEELIKFTNLVGPYISMIKINSNNIFNINILQGLKKLGNHYNFLIFDDRKSAIRKSEDLLFLDEIKTFIDYISIYYNSNNIKFLEKYRETGPGIILSGDQLDLIDYIKYNSKLIFGVQTNNITDSYLSLVEYSYYKNNLDLLKNSGVVIIGKELCSHANPIKIIEKLNTII